MFKLALIQMRVVGGAKEANLARAEHFIAEAAMAGAQVVLLPETLNLGWTHRSAHGQADGIPEGGSCVRLCAAARRHAVFVCAGLVERAGKRLFNAAVLISPQGEVLLHHRKLNELDIAHDLYARGDRLAVVPTALGTLGVMICADAFAPGQVVSRTLGLMGANVILSPCAWAMPADHDNRREPYGSLWLENYVPVARDFRLWIAGCSNVGWIDDGPWQGRKCIGCSLVVAPDGTPALRGPYGVDAEAMLLVDCAPY
ncbi:MAG: carbon-nitrogen hydrolase family protein [Opitutus sp.]|nr:carbon-nitrogen hydrolase family protein [Opitutus sp.]